MKRIFQNLLLMIQLLTRFPLNISLPCETEDFKRGGNFFFIVGIIIGGIQLIVFNLLYGYFSIDIVVIILIIIEVLITGGFHIDGLGDSCDGFFAFKGKDKIIDIMKDSRIGTFACIGIIIDLAIKFVGYNEAITIWGSGVILIVPIISRVAITIISYIGKPAKESGTGNLFINTMSLGAVIINIVGFIIIAVLILPVKNIVVISAGGVIMILAFNAYCNKKINGITGDSLGAMNEIVMMGVLMLLSGSF